MPPHGKSGVDSFARTDTQKKNTVYEKAQNNRHRKRQKQYDKGNVYAAVEGAKSTRGELPY